ncbi:MAG: hypothetical protein R3327_06080 [Nitrosopumilaceae archaeon]|nr:hypothetical protein [Nitrosopumilaceae archaeon]
MTSDQIYNFRTIMEFQNTIDAELKETNQQIESYSKLIGEKIRQEEKDKNEDFSELKEKLESSNQSDPKSKSKSKPKKSKKSSKNKSEDWIEYEEIKLFNGIGAKGELELYFKFLERLKNKAQKLQGTKSTIEKLLATGIKKELGCLSLSKEDGTYDITFVNTTKKEKFSYKSVITVRCEA